MAIEQQNKSEKEIKEMTKESMEKVASEGATDIFVVRGGDPNKVYRFLNTHKQNLEMKKVRGWKIVSDPKIKTLSGSLDSTHQIGDLILAEMPKEKYDKMMKDKRDLGDQRRKRSRQEFRELGARAGVKVFEEKD